MQPGRATVQGELERAILAVSGEKRRIVGAGRTDAGVHAKGQVVSFSTDSRLDVPTWCRALNAHLPDTIVVHHVRQAPEGFNARYSARSRAYRYTILNRQSPAAIGRQYHWHVARPLDVTRMEHAASKLVGTRDFAPFAGSSGDERRSTVRTVSRASCARFGDELYVDVEADAFLTHMVRNIVGGLVEVGLGNADDVQPGRTAPPHGLCLTAVHYEVTL